MNEFFVVALPGLEDIVDREIELWFPTLERHREHGGVKVIAPLEQGLAMNLVLKTATRVLLRIKTFRCRDFPKLYNMIKKIDWQKWVDPRCELEVNVATRLSRLKIKSKIQSTCEDAWMDYRASLKVTAQRGVKASLYVRFHNDDCTLSLDTSGERLHKRGVRDKVGKAPLRETIGAALMYMAAAHAPDAKTIEIADPMMGSGMFLLEGASLFTPVSAREFAFETFAVKKVSPPQPLPKFEVSRVIGFESDKNTFKAAQENLKTVASNCEICLYNQDVFTAKSTPPAPVKRWLFANPPYGQRLKVKEPLAELYVRLFDTCERLMKPDLACFLLPSDAVRGKFRLPIGWKVIEKRPFLNGGIPVVAFLFECQARRDISPSGG